MKKLPTIETQRLVLRPFELSDAGEVQHLAGEKEVAANTLYISHPYSQEQAEKWISGHRDSFKRGESMHLAVTLKSDGSLIGAIGFMLRPEHCRGELTYWSGKAYWRRGYCTEAAGTLVKYGFDVLDLNRIYAGHFQGNIASEHVLAKIGMKYEGCLRQYVKKWERFEDVRFYSILRSEYEPQKK